jgi:hypothetical protein
MTSYCHLEIGSLQKAAVLLNPGIQPGGPAPWLDIVVVDRDVEIQIMASLTFQVTQQPISHIPMDVLKNVFGILFSPHKCLFQGHPSLGGLKHIHTQRGTGAVNCLTTTDEGIG